MAKIMESPLELKSKVSGGGAVSTEMLARGDAAIAEIAVEYPSLALQDIDELTALYQTAMSKTHRSL